jgi:hypothetical protein
MTDESANAIGPARPYAGGPLIATRARWAACSLALAAGAVIAAEAALAFVHLRSDPAALARLFIALAAAGSVVAYLLLRAEESRTTRELRTARAGTPSARALAIRRDERIPFFARPFSSGLAAAAVRVADGDRRGALEALRRGSPLLRGGRVERLRGTVEADLERATGTPAGLDRAIARLRATPPVGHREADRYRAYVLVRAVLERGDDETALVLARELEGSPDEEVALYALWLRAWFELDGDDEEPHWPPVDEARARLATLAARAHGAERLVDKLEERLLAIAHREQQG